MPAVVPNAARSRAEPTRGVRSRGDGGGAAAETAAAREQDPSVPGQQQRLGAE